MVELDGLIPAPYFARIGWVAAERWDVFRTKQWEQEFQAAHALTLAKLPPKTRRVFALPAKEQQKLIAERRALLKAKG